VFISTRNLDAACREETENGQMLAIIEPQNPEFPRFTFDKASGLLARIGQLSFGDYQEFHGIRLPTVFQLGPQIALRIGRISVEGNRHSPLADSEAYPYDSTASPSPEQDFAMVMVQYHVGKAQSRAAHLPVRGRVGIPEPCSRSRQSR
jgi:hypothetical protein